MFLAGDNLIFPLDNSEFEAALDPPPEESFDTYYDYEEEDGDYDYEYYYADEETQGMCRHGILQQEVDYYHYSGEQPDITQSSRISRPLTRFDNHPMVGEAYRAEYTACMRSECAQTPQKCPY